MTYTPQYLVDETLKAGTDKINANFEDLVDALGAAEGFATLDENSKLSSDQIPASIVGALVYQGVWDCSTEAYPVSADAGDYWVASVAGTISEVAYSIHDWLIYNGTTWDKIDNQTPVISVNTKVGTVSLSAADVSAVPSSYLDTDVTLAANSDAKVSTQKATKAYVHSYVYDYFDGIVDIEIDPDLLAMDYIPDNYTPTVEPSCSSIEQLAAHLKGINDELASIKARLTAHSI